MSHGKSVVIGCDDAMVLSSILVTIEENNPFALNFISVSRESDLITISKSLNPSLVILCFENNQSAIENFEYYVAQSEIPILCLTRSENEMLCWSDKNIVFTYPLKYIGHKDYLSSRIRSIFLLKGESDLKVNATINQSEVQPGDEEQERNLSRYVMELDQKKEILMKVKQRITELFPAVDDPVRLELTSIVNSIKSAYGDTKIWEDFKMSFEKIAPDFLSQLSGKHPSLTSKDLKYCCYLKMNMSNDDIRSLLGINQESVRTHKYRLKKKMALSKEQDLRQYVGSVGRTAFVHPIYSE